ncbi:MAG: DUF2161 family putative PD-(D/E)XK-type phosphodiesterase [Bacillota bacterium]|nr:DUF2161 family putative PD-(D/E)XK-type phosphodiesterase [Bacillota bacterium]
MKTNILKLYETEKTLSILSKNYHGWFNKIQRGMYSISEKGKSELSKFLDQVQHFFKCKD